MRLLKIYVGGDGKQYTNGGLISYKLSCVVYMM